MKPPWVQLSIALVLGWATTASVLGQGAPPAERCDFNGARVDAAVRRTVGLDPAPYYLTCHPRTPSANDAGCIRDSLQPGVVVSVDRERSGWSCVAAGGTSGWVETLRLEELPAEPRPRPTDWVGWWTRSTTADFGDGVLVLTTGATPGSLRVSGRAFWHGRGDTVHSGQVDGEAVPVGNHLHFVEVGPSGETSGCVVDLTLTHQGALQSWDNMQCGGMNVGFRGDWRKF